MRVLQNGHVLARLSAVRQRSDRLTAIWHGAPPPFLPSEQVEPLVLESDDALERREGWLLDVVIPTQGDGPLRVEIGSEHSAPPWRQSEPPSERQNTPGPKRALDEDDILVVDDDPETVELVASALVDEGFSVRRAAGGREALARMAERVPRVAIIDLIMPEIGGEQVCAELRRNPHFSSTRVLVLSGAEDTRLVAAACDADSAVTKPFTTELLVHEVRRLIGQ
ncbi:MAG TPA: response regulator [Polyangiaceae bacterium]|nr:response regulator [Polyangiaceae bacterium]